jgi:hypothetical protein
VQDGQRTAFSRKKHIQRAADTCPVSPPAPTATLTVKPVWVLLLNPIDYAHLIIKSVPSIALAADKGFRQQNPSAKTTAAGQQWPGADR